MGQNQTRSSRTRERLAEAAIGLFAERGYDETSIDDIAARAGVSRRTVFRHFPSKGDAAFHHWDVWLDAVERALAERDPSEPVLRSIALAVESSVPSFLDRKGLALEAMRVIRATPALRDHPRAFVDRYTRTLARFIKARAPDKPAMLSEMVAAAAMAAVRYAQREWAASNGALDPVVPLRESFAVLRAAFGPQLEAHAAGNEPTVIVISPTGAAEGRFMQKLGDLIAAART